ncbi:hypothetical protein K438DRAFT_1786939 [Mycena galopus ATCC 62051]|nr:hypothetical protein K438DRAFT_1786939 [Mycena galopus ATCC 62051]
MDLDGIVQEPAPPYSREDPFPTPEGPPPAYQHPPSYEDVVGPAEPLGELVGMVESPMARDDDIASVRVEQPAEAGLLGRIRQAYAGAKNNTLPASVLDLGCGTGLWLLDAARMWRATQFVGLDLVDVGLPAFADGAVPNLFAWRICRCAKSEDVLRDVAPVLLPGGRLELVDETFFLYGDAPEEEAVEAEGVADKDLMSPTPTAHPLQSPALSDALSPNTLTPPSRAPPPTPDSSAFFHSSDDEDENNHADADERRSRAATRTSRSRSHPTPPKRSATEVDMDPPPRP